MNEYVYLKTKDDIDALLKSYADFHDSCISGLNIKTGRYVDSENCIHSFFEETGAIHITFNSQATGTELELCFEGLKEFKIVGDNKHFGDIFDCTLMFYSDDSLLWADSAAYRVAGNNDNISYVIASEIKYRITE